MTDQSPYPTSPIPQSPYWRGDTPPAPKKRRRWPWLAAGAVSLLLLGSCLGDLDDVDATGQQAPPSASAPASPSPQQAEPTPSEEPTEEPTEETSPEPEPEETEEPLDDRDLQRLALEMAWEQSTKEDQNLVCLGWAVDREGALDQVLAGAESEGQEFDRKVVGDFFDDACADEA